MYVRLPFGLWPLHHTALVFSVFDRQAVAEVPAHVASGDLVLPEELRDDHGDRDSQAVVLFTVPAGAVKGRPRGQVGPQLEVALLMCVVLC